MIGGEIDQYTALLEDSRRTSMNRMIENARLMFDSPAIGGTLTEVVA